MSNRISRATLGRVPLYYRHIEKMSPEIETISSSSIAKELGLGEVQVRKDLSALCGNGRPRIGYQRKDLQEKLRSYLDNDDGGTIIVGAGKLGIALLNYKGFEEYGLNILAAFDHNPKKIYGSDNKNIYHSDQLKDFCENHHVKIGVITVPAFAAQEAFDELYECGIRLFWCFAPIHLKTPDDVVVKYENMALSLAHLKQHDI